MEKKIIDHFCHEHSLILEENYVSENESRICYACGNHISNVESAYVCMEQDCLDWPIFHKKCGELPNKIMLPKHPQHPLYLTDFHKKIGHWWCDICGRDLVEVLVYECSCCDFALDLACEKISIDAVLEERKQLQHPCHPDHPLTLMRKSAFAFYCDGCGTQDVDMAYICITCEFWIHKACASLPLTLRTNHHHHQLSMALSIPMEHRKYIGNCDVCGKRFDMTCWVYFCGVCRFFAHLNCAATTTTDTTNLDSNLQEEENDDNDGSEVIQFPLDGHDIAKKLTTPFVMREKGLNKIPEVKDMSENSSARFSTLTYNYHNHPLSLVLESLEDEEDHNKDEDEDDESKICDSCVTPISSPPYYKCASCQYFIHSICYLLPETLSLPLPSSSSSPQSRHQLLGECSLTHNKIHKFNLNSNSEWRRGDHCEVCYLYTNGGVYKCEDCTKKMDVKCASLPTTIRHSSHPYHKQPLIMTLVMKQDRWKSCSSGCGFLLQECDVAYCCHIDGCDFALHLLCAQLPVSVVRREWDKHPLLLTYDASLDHPGDFICAFCEEEMNPKNWMYNCRLCDNSFHLFCLRDASGFSRNLKLGRRVVLDGIHPHPLTFNCITLVKRCSLCRVVAYDILGLECASCNFAICFRCIPEN